ncbi:MULTISPECIES: hypothetical protein [Mycobacterium]|uniref:DUF732 domain-containing protein n=1 Tax=Mycobacterium kiyosense TaxID=2871094 RepID=A0A9P3Q1I1_9MYCO|nr:MULTISPECIES: hypothetical protein [Mycobacterium]BDB41533.1 hypothetical protein IWGMT90018_19790 [Mycobacterium kiyosense]BDE15165.1 hypothetical protein MKCMC460_40250 [Mycobacterium sp. 20KCMC460]GLB81648.1 hypothetical protein SRL2020028_09040 [Mycobacterium kiyosense]GLB87573.1 hypothetical protein SRL2020130_03900 [Mycobacterium kiyosense]GLB94228.1 hypothetical protein SRL2020226_10040 [Mycobacterium kiyosense]
MSKKLIIGAVVSAGMAVGLAPTAHADINAEVCEAVMAYSINPYDPSDHYALNMLQRYPNMTYNQANDLVKKAFGSVRYHDNPMCNGFSLPENY